MTNLGTTGRNYPSIVITTETGAQMDSTQYTHDEDENLPIRQYRKKNIYRSMALVPATLLMLCSGLQLFWGIYSVQSIFQQTTKESYYHLVFAFFIATIIGAAVAAVLMRKYQKCYFYNAGGALMLISGILFTALPLNIGALAAARYLSGIAHGLVFVSVVIHAGEISTKRLRGELLSGINTSITSGILMTTFLYRIEVDQNSNLHVNVIYGITIIILSLIALVFIPFLVKESPVFLIDAGKDNEAFSLLLQLQKQTVETPGVRHQFTDLKNMVNEEENESGIIFFDGNWVAILQATLLRGLLALAMSMPINLFLYLPFSLLTNLSISITIPVLIRLIGELIATYFIDRIGRRKLLLISAGGSGILLLIWGILAVANLQNGIMAAMAAITSFYQFFLGIGLSNVSVAYIGEAFPLSKKAYSILFVVSVESLIHLFVILPLMVASINLTALVFVTGIFLLLAEVYFFKFFPETKFLSLRESRNAVKQSSTL